MDYKSSGVDIDAGHEVVRRIRGLAQGTFTPGVLSDIGAFGGLFHLQAAGASDPVLVASADGVGTKLKVAFMMNRHTTIGEDLVNHCVNDILVQGARPLFFLDYLATGRLSPDVAVDIVDGLARACKANGCALLGGETAEMPGFYANREYDLAGFIVGVVERQQVLTGDRIRVGDALIGLPSSGLHTNGYSLARRIAFDTLMLGIHDHIPEIGGGIGEALLRPHRSYLNPVMPLVHDGLISAMAHITGGGLTDNVPRVLPEGTSARIDRSAWDVPALFTWLVREGDVPDADAWRTFNMGIGMVLVVPAQQVNRVLERLSEAGESEGCVIGEIVSGSQDVQYVGIDA
jgi:phosphoribosylformylglycinamidine cyclo-ligase